MSDSDSPNTEDSKVPSEKKELTIYEQYQAMKTKAVESFAYAKSKFETTMITIDDFRIKVATYKPEKTINYLSSKYFEPLYKCSNELNNYYPYPATLARNHSYLILGSSALLVGYPLKCK